MPTTLRLYDGYRNRPELSDEVFQLQQSLAQLGYDINPDGKYGPGTQTAVMTFQRDKDLQADGVAGPATWKALQTKQTQDKKTEGFINLPLTLTLLKTIMPQGRESRLAMFCPALNRQLPDYQITSPLRQAHFLAQIAHESAQLNTTIENLNYSAKALRSVFGKYFPSDEMANAYARQPEKIGSRIYADRMGNGNETSTEGWKFRGRGLIQLTGKDNYRRFGQATGSDYIQNPEPVDTDADIAVQAACWYWNIHKLNHYADADDIRSITRKINGGYNGMDDREALLKRAKQAFNI
ncbi:MAG: peptidoglycan-binding protein [Owenweeksia sp.]